MSRLQSLKVFINQRLSAAVEEVIGRLEKELTEYEEELESRQRRLLDAASNPGNERRAAVFSAGVLQQLVIKQEVQDDPQQLFWTSQGVWAPLQGSSEGHTDRFPAVLVHVKSEDEEKYQTQLLQTQTEEAGEAEPQASSSAARMKTMAGGGPEPDHVVVSGFKCVPGSGETTSHSSETEDSSDDWKPQVDLKTVKKNVAVTNVGQSAAVNKPFSCSKCGKRFEKRHHLEIHMRCHTRERPYSCPQCDSRFTQKASLKRHLTLHTREKPRTCPVCGERFAQQGNLTQHMTVHIREKL